MLIILFMALTVCQVTSQADQNSAGTQERTGNPEDVLANEEIDSLQDEAHAKYLGFSCPKGHSCLPVLNCLPCEYGTYMDNKSSNVCKNCPPDCTTLRKGAESREECVPFCPPGYEMSHCNKTCTKCRPGTFKSNWEKNAPCSKCPVGSNPPEDAIGLMDESQCHVDDCVMSCSLWSRASLLCRHDVRSFMGCLDSCPADQHKKKFLSKAFSNLYPDVGSQLTHQLNNNKTWKQMFDWYNKEACPDDCVMSCTLSSDESLLCRYNVKNYMDCLDRCPADQHKKSYLSNAFSNLHPDLESQLTHELNNNKTWKQIFDWYNKEACPDTWTIWQKCKNSSMIVPHPSECQLYYNCSIPFMNHQTYNLRSLEEHMVECPYPLLFDTKTEKCEDFDTVDCGNRTEIADACKYRETQCYWAHCIPCRSRFPSCIGKTDGANVYYEGLHVLTSAFIVCYKERYISREHCSEDSNGNHQAFHPVLKTCMPRPRFGGSFMNECWDMMDGTYIDYSGRCDQFRVCKDAKATIVKCNEGEVFDTVRGVCWPYESACGFCSESGDWTSC